MDSRKRVAGSDSDFEVDLGESLHLQSDARLAVYKIRLADSFLSTDRGRYLYWVDGAYTGARLAPWISSNFATATYSETTNSLSVAYDGDRLRAAPAISRRGGAVQRGPQPSAPAHASASNSQGGFRTPAQTTDEDVRLARRYQGGTRFVEDDLAGDPEAGALASNGQGPPSITDRLRSTADGAQAAADLIGAGAAGLAAAQAFRSQLPQDAAEYVRLNVLLRPGPAASADHRPAQ